MKRVCCCSGSSRMIFLAFFFSLLAAVCRSQSAGDAEVMQDLKKSLISDKGIGWDDANPCKWTHLTCSGDRVTMIQIMELNLQGTLPASLSKLTGLQVFEAMRNQLTGPLPRFAPSLQRVQLNENNFTSIPPDFFKGMNSLQTVSLDKNSFYSWVISDDVFKGMNSLQTFSASQANITGPLPDFSKNIQLQNLSLSDNMLTGPVPDSLVGLQSLYMVNLTNNRLQGRRPKFSSSVQIHDMAAGLNRFCLPDPGVNCDPRVNNLLQVSRDLGYPYSLADSWNGNDPCGGSWEGITCNSGGDITVVNFERMSLHGKISPSFSNILSLQRLILSGNYLTGTL